jgi:hypothetical protein
LGWTGGGGGGGGGSSASASAPPELAAPAVRPSPLATAIPEEVDEHDLDDEEEGGAAARAATAPGLLDRLLFPDETEYIGPDAASPLAPAAAPPPPPLARPAAEAATPLPAPAAKGWPVSVKVAAAVVCVAAAAAAVVASDPRRLAEAKKLASRLTERASAEGALVLKALTAAYAKAMA